LAAAGLAAGLAAGAGLAFLPLGHLINAVVLKVAPPLSLILTSF